MHPGHPGPKLSPSLPLLAVVDDAVTVQVNQVGVRAWVRLRLRFGVRLRVRIRAKARARARASLRLRGGARGV